MTKKLTGKVALITGGSRGIGAAIARRLARDGAAVAITYAAHQPRWCVPVAPKPPDHALYEWCQNLERLMCCLRRFHWPIERSEYLGREKYALR